MLGVLSYWARLGVGCARELFAGVTAPCAMATMRFPDCWGFTTISKSLGVKILTRLGVININANIEIFICVGVDMTLLLIFLFGEFYNLSFLLCICFNFLVASALCFIWIYSFTIYPVIFVLFCSPKPNKYSIVYFHLRKLFVVCGSLLWRVSWLERLLEFPHVCVHISLIMQQRCRRLF